MRGLPKRFGTAEDIRNCYAMVQAGELDAEELLEAIEEWEAQGFANCPIVETNNKTITLVYCPEISDGDMAFEKHTLAELLPGAFEL